MEKESIVQVLSSAKVAHLKCVQKAKSLISGMPINNEVIPLGYKDCMFGKWFYSVGQEISMMPGMSVMDSIGMKHKELHEIYFKIFQIYFTEDEKSFFSKLLKIKRKISSEEQEIAEQYYEELKVTSKELLRLTGKLERRIGALSEDFFNTK